MADAPTTPTEPKPGAEPAPAAKVEEPKSYSPEHVKALRDEAKSHRERAEALEAKLAAEAKAKADAEKAKLESEGNWKALAEAERKRADEIAGKATERDALAKQLDDLKTVELAGLPEDMRALVADLPPAKAIELARKLTKQNAGPGAAPAVNGGAPPSPKAPIDLSRMTQAEAEKIFRTDPSALADWQKRTFKRRTTF